MQYQESTDHTERLTFNSDGTATIIRYSPFTGKFNKATLKITKEQYNRWKNREGLIQDLFPNLSTEEREFLMTGYTPDDWDKMWKE
jgi:hypothetical protein